ncbi:MAG: ATP phosphoribosyltransferase [Halobacteriales archaeon]|nr:ATP phosphoribosyltransferase [Halobacteriales archaeon]
MRIAVPNKGRLSEPSVQLLRDAGLGLGVVEERALFATAPQGFTVLFLRAADIPEFVQDGVAECGITGLDIVRESRKEVEVLMDLDFGHCKLVVAAPEDSRIKDAKDVPDGARVATSFPHLAQEFFDALGKRVKLVEVSGATEVTPHIGVADVIVDLAASGSTLKVHRMRPIGTVLESSARLVAGKQAMRDAGKAARVRELAWALQSVVQAKGKHYIMANVPRAKLDEVARVMPGISGPTIVELGGQRSDLVAAHAVVSERDLYHVVRELKALGAEGILVIPISRLMT